MIARLERWIRWPLWSWRNLTVTTVALLAIFTAIGRLTTTADLGAERPPRNTVATVPTASPTETPASPAPATTAAPGTSAQASPGQPGRPVAPQPGSRTPVEVAALFATAWAQPSASQATWLSDLEPLATPEFLASLRTVDPARVPASKVLDSGSLTSSGDQRATVRVATDAGGMTVTLVVVQSGKWLVADIAPADQPPGATTPPLSPSPTGRG